MANTDQPFVPENPFRFLARSNQQVNSLLLGLMEKHQDLLERPLQGYFSSIKAILEHLYVADALWGADIAFSLNLPTKALIVIGELPRYDTFTFKDVGQFRKLRQEMDRRWIELVEEIQPADLARAVVDCDAQEIQSGRPLGKVLSHVFNHQTHHRGQISLALEMFGVEHSFSDILELE